MFSKIFGAGAPVLPPPQKNNRYHTVSNDFGGWARTSITLTSLKNPEIFMVLNVFGGWAGAPHHPPTSRKNNRNHDVFNDFGGWAEAPITSDLPRKLQKS